MAKRNPRIPKPTKQHGLISKAKTAVTVGRAVRQPKPPKPPKPPSRKGLVGGVRYGQSKPKSNPFTPSSRIKSLKPKPQPKAGKHPSTRPAPPKSKGGKKTGKAIGSIFGGKSQLDKPIKRKHPKAKDITVPKPKGKHPKHPDGKKHPKPKTQVPKGHSGSTYGGKTKTTKHGYSGSTAGASYSGGRRKPPKGKKHGVKGVGPVKAKNAQRRQPGYAQDVMGNVLDPYGGESVDTGGGFDDGSGGMPDFSALFEALFNPPEFDMGEEPDYSQLGIPEELLMSLFPQYDPDAVDPSMYDQFSSDLDFSPILDDYSSSETNSDSYTGGSETERYTYSTPRSSSGSSGGSGGSSGGTPTGSTVKPYVVPDLSRILGGYLASVGGGAQAANPLEEWYRIYGTGV